MQCPAVATFGVQARLLLLHGSLSLANLLPPLLPQQVNGRVTLPLQRTRNTMLICKVGLARTPGEHDCSSYNGTLTCPRKAPGQQTTASTPAADTSDQPTCARTAPTSAKVENWPVMYTPSSLRWPMLICTAPWSFDVMSLLVHELQHASNTQRRQAKGDEHQRLLMQAAVCSPSKRAQQGPQACTAHVLCNMV